MFIDIKFLEIDKPEEEELSTADCLPNYHRNFKFDHKIRKQAGTSHDLSASFRQEWLVLRSLLDSDLLGSSLSVLGYLHDFLQKFKEKSDLIQVCLFDRFSKALAFVLESAHSFKMRYQDLEHHFLQNFRSLCLSNLLLVTNELVEHDDRHFKSLLAELG